MEYITKDKVKAGDYIALEIGQWQDDDGNNFENGVCYGHVTGYNPEQWDEEDEEYYEVFECSEVIYADGEFGVNDSLGVGNNKIRYMNDEEINYFINKHNEYINK